MSNTLPKPSVSTILEVAFAEFCMLNKDKLVNANLTYQPSSEKQRDNSGITRQPHIDLMDD